MSFHVSIFLKNLYSRNLSELLLKVQNKLIFQINTVQVGFVPIFSMFLMCINIRGPGARGVPCHLSEF